MKHLYASLLRPRKTTLLQSRIGRIDIQAKVIDPAKARINDHIEALMIRSLLMNRFNLKVHYETRTLPVYALVAPKGASQLKEAKADDSVLSHFQIRGSGHIQSHSETTENLAQVLSELLGKEVVDKTRLTGRYDFTLNWAPDEGLLSDAAQAASGGKFPNGPSQVSETSGPDLATALKEQLGLRLEIQKLPSQIVVIEHVDQPSTN